MPRVSPFAGDTFCGVLRHLTRAQRARALLGVALELKAIGYRWRHHGPTWTTALRDHRRQAGGEGAHEA